MTRLPTIHAEVVYARLDELAADLGRLRKRLDPESSAYWTWVRCADAVLSLDLMLHSSAAQIAAWTYPGDDAAVQEAIRLTDERCDRLARTLGKEAQ
jgi:hypothetical protein